MNWAHVPAENISELVGGGLMSIILEAGRPDDADDSAPLIRTLRPINAQVRCTPPPKREPTETLRDPGWISCWGEGSSTVSSI